MIRLWKASTLKLISSALKDQVSFNKMIEDRLACLIALVPPVDNAKAVVMRGVRPLTTRPILTIQDPRKPRKRVKIATTSR
jgi:hypothetical protein